MKPMKPDDLPRLSARANPAEEGGQSAPLASAGDIMRRFFQLLSHLDHTPPPAPEVKARITRMDGQG
jgi:hypothetical protein